MSKPTDLRMPVVWMTREQLEALYPPPEPDYDPEEGLPWHKKSGYAERMYELAEDERKRRREENK